MVRIAILLCGIVAYVYADCLPSITTIGGHKATATVCSGELVFQDEFDTFDFTTWTHESTLSGCGNNEFEWYTNNRSNSYVKDGILYIVPTLTIDHIGEAGLSSATINLNQKDFGCTMTSNDGCERTGTPEHVLNPIKSARIRTTDSFYFTYGRIEVRAKLSKGDWLWPAIWMMARDGVYGAWPLSGEIDITEARANEYLMKNGEQIGIQQHGATLHWGLSSSENQWPLTHWTKNIAEGWNADFHVYGVIWTNESIAFTVDGEVLGSVAPSTSFWDFGDLGSTNRTNPWEGGSKMAPFDQHFYIVMNLATGSDSYFDEVVTANGSPKPWVNGAKNATTDFWNARGDWYPTWHGLNTSLQVDYVRVYAI